MTNVFNYSMIYMGISKNIKAKLLNIKYRTSSLEWIMN